MKYIIMCGGNYKHWAKPRHLSIINGEEIVARTIRLLRENGIEDISISSDNPIFEKFGVPVLKHDNLYNCKWHDTLEGSWLNCFYLTDEPVCYILGDVVFSPEAIKKIVETDTDDIELFGSVPPFASNYIKNHIEAFGLKVVNLEHFNRSLQRTRELDKEGKFYRKPIIWELWTVIKNNPIQKKGEEYIYDYTCINDYTCDIDWQEDITKFNKLLGGEKMIKCEVTEKFTLSKFEELSNIVRKNGGSRGALFVGDVFECNEEMADYLTGNNPKKIAVVKIIEVIPEKEKEIVTPKVEEKTEELEKVVSKPKSKKKKKAVKKGE